MTLTGSHITGWTDVMVESCWTDVMVQCWSYPDQTHEYSQTQSTAARRVGGGIIKTYISNQTDLCQANGTAKDSFINHRKFSNHRPKPIQKKARRSRWYAGNNRRLNLFQRKPSQTTLRFFTENLEREFILSKY